MEVNYVEIFIAFAGALIHLLMKATDKTDSSVSLKGLFSGTNILKHVLSILSVVVCFIMKDEIISVLGITIGEGSSAPYLFAFFIGYNGDSLIRNLIGIFEKKQI
jgi:hypothetical protein